MLVKGIGQKTIEKIMASLNTAPAVDEEKKEAEGTEEGTEGQS